MTSTIAESGGYTGTFSLSGETCASGGSVDGGQIATVSPTTGIANPTTLTVTSDEAGKCTFTFRDANNNIAVLSVDVTTTSVVINRKNPVPHKVAPGSRPQSVTTGTPATSSAIKPTPQAGVAPHLAH